MPDRKNKHKLTDRKEVFEQPENFLNMNFVETKPGVGVLIPFSICGSLQCSQYSI
jgi:hypothetical protein